MISDSDDQVSNPQEMLSMPNLLQNEWLTQLTFQVASLLVSVLEPRFGLGTAGTYVADRAAKTAF